jgi:hypothetical protein
MLPRRFASRALVPALALAAGGGGTLAACGSSDEDEARAVAQEFKRAIDAKDGERACRLLSPPARRTMPDCARQVTRLDPGDVVGGATVRGDRATIASRDAAGTPGPGRTTLQRVDGTWRVASYGHVNQTFASPAATAAYARCWRAAGARIATRPQDLSFAAADAPIVAVRRDSVSAKGRDWRIFYTLPAGGRDPGIREVIADPMAAGVVAYVADARANARVVVRARACTAAG